MKLITTTAMLLMCTAHMFAQTDSTKASGNWNAASTWKSGNVPTGTGIYIIRSTDSVYFSAAATITGMIKSLSGKVGVFDSSKIVFGNGGVYEHAAEGGSLIKAQWSTGSTCLITGVITNAPSNGNQNFYNLTWNCIGQTSNTNLGMADNTIGGTVRIMESKTFQVRLTAGSTTVPSGRKLITINGNIVIDTSTANFTSTGSGTPSDTFSVVVKGNIISKGSFVLANGSGAMVNWFVGGNIDLSAGSFTTNSTATLPDSLIFNGTSKQTFTRGGAVTSSNIRFAIRNGAVVDFDTSTLGGSSASTMTLASGGTMISGHAKGMTGNFNVGGAKTYSTSANYEYAGKVAQTDTSLPSAVRNLTINNTAGFTLAKPVTINGVLALKAGQLDNTIPFTLGAGGSISYLGGSLKVPTSVRPLNGSGIPETFFVDQNFPNPFNPVTTISYGLAQSGMVSASLYSVLGQHVAELFNGYKNAGVHTISVDASKLSSGVYLYHIRSGQSVETKRMVLMK